MQRQNKAYFNVKMDKKPNLKTTIGKHYVGHSTSRYEQKKSQYRHTNAIKPGHPNDELWMNF